MGLYAEQLSGTPFTFAKHKNKRSWLYRIMPSCNHSKWEHLPKGESWVSDFSGSDKATHSHMVPDQSRWNPYTNEKWHTFVEGIHTMMGAGGP